MEYSVYGRWRLPIVIDGPQLERAASRFRPEDDSVCVWRDRQTLTDAGFSTDVNASSYEQALETGRALLNELGAALRQAGSPVEVVAMTDSGQARWSQ